MPKLTAVFCKSTKEVKSHGDGDGLYLRVQRSTRDPNQVNKSWLYRWGAGGSGGSMSLGVFPEVSLQGARELAAEARKQVREGFDPRQLKAAKIAVNAGRQAGLTFEQAAENYINIKKQGWRNKKHVAQWGSTLEKYAFPQIGKKLCKDVVTNDVKSILDPIWMTKHETASRVRERIERVLDWAMVTEGRDDQNPAIWKGRLNHLLPLYNVRANVKHHASMPYADVPEYAKELKSERPISAQALLFCILTATRTGEAIMAGWTEIDFINGIWAIPMGRMKRLVEHRVPLSTQAIYLLSSMNKSSNWLFPSVYGNKKPISNMAMLNYLKGRQKNSTYTVHGFRSSFRNWVAAKTQHQSEVAEHALSHGLNDATVEAYLRDDYIDKRRSLMQDWANYCL